MTFPIEIYQEILQYCDPLTQIRLTFTCKYLGNNLKISEEAKTYISVNSKKSAIAANRASQIQQQRKLRADALKKQKEENEKKLLNKIENKNMINAPKETEWLIKKIMKLAGKGFNKCLVCKNIKITSFRQGVYGNSENTREYKLIKLAVNKYHIEKLKKEGFNIVDDCTGFCKQGTIFKVIMVSW